MGVNVVSSLLLACLWVGWSQAFIVITHGNCPNIPIQENFDVNRYLGTWYSYENFDAPFQYGATCVKAQYSLLPNGNIKVNNSGYTETKVFRRVVSREYTEAIGQAQIVDQNNKGGLRVQFGGQPDLGDDGANYLIVSTDYTSYSLVYSCSKISRWLPFKIEFAWLLTRKQGQEPPQRSELMQLLTDYNVNVKYFKKIKHTDCFPLTFQEFLRSLG